VTAAKRSAAGAGGGWRWTTARRALDRLEARFVFCMG